MLRYLIVRSPDPAEHARARRVFADAAACGVLEVGLGPAGGGLVTVFVENPDTARIRPRVPVHADDREVVFYDGMPMHPEFDAFDAGELARNWARVEGCVGRFTFVRADRGTGRVEVRLDATSGAPVYRAWLAGGGLLLTSVPRVAHVLAPRGGLDPTGVAGLLCVSTPLGNSTLTTAVSVMELGTTLVLEADGTERSAKVDPTTLGGTHPCDLPASEAARLFAEYYRPVLTRMEEAGLNMRASLTGGRDSRASASLLGASVKQLRVAFGGSENGKETRVVRQAAAAMGAELTVNSEPFAPGTLNYAAAERYLFDRDCGMELLLRARNPPGHRPSPEDDRPVTLGGHAGEIARWSFESLTGVFFPPSESVSRHRVVTRILSKGSGVFSHRPLEIAKSHVNGMVDHALAAGVTLTNLQTVVVNLLKAPRWGSMQMTRLAEKSDPVIPFLTAPFLSVAMRIPPGERFRDRFHYELIRRCCPGGLRAPFYTYSNTGHRLVNELVREVIIRSPAVKRLHARRRGPHVNATWEPWIRPIFREQVAGHDPASPVWEFLDRPALEAALSEPESFVALYYEVYKAMTLIRFWDWYTELTAQSR